MSDSLARRKLARAAAHLAAHTHYALPPLVLFTDDERLPDPLAAARTLPRGSMVVVRSRDSKQRAALARAMVDLSRACALIVLVAGDGALAAASGANGLHLPEACLGEAAAWRARYSSLLITGSVHSLAALAKAKLLDAVFLSPVFPTTSHPGRATLTAVRANMIARGARLPVYALGGVEPCNAGLLSGFAGIAAISALDVQA